MPEKQNEDPSSVILSKTGNNLLITYMHNIH